MGSDLGVFFTVITTIMMMVATATVRSVRDLRTRKVGPLRWHDTFEDLPARARTCRFAMSGAAPGRSCDNYFECGTCEMFPQFHAREQRHHLVDLESGAGNGGFTIPENRYYHRGHTWIQEVEGGTCVIGLDDFAVRLLGPNPTYQLPPAGSTLEQHQPAFTIQTGESTVRVVSPIDGEVIEAGDSARGWLLRIRPSTQLTHARHLFRGGEVRRWFQAEMERLNQLIEIPGVGATLADGGTPVDNFRETRPNANWDAILGVMMLDV